MPIINAPTITYGLICFKVCNSTQPKRTKIAHSNGTWNDNPKSHNMRVINVVDDVISGMSLTPGGSASAKNWNMSGNTTIKQNIIPIIKSNKLPPTTMMKNRFS
ncbi:MAG: hypothetical protein A3F46_00125 [Legionellales bacterium RIFCSPHIGHO2_12_FULL_42_9]|nr:MAG: hypothetical protein A3F46_00125 [Legionellales bacterium RIFCSPHIGHO2_12_FULL_42_9]